MKLILVRHAKAMDRVKALLKEVDDENRPLTRKGKLKFSAHVEKLKRVFTGAELFVSSEYLRARETTELLIEVLEGGSAAGRSAKAVVRQLAYVVLKGIAPDSSPETLLKWLKSRKEKKLVIVGHEPFLTKFLSKQSKKPFKDKIKKGAVICADINFSASGEMTLKVEKIYQP
jgi:phosphohistidine phosphatase SixA